MLAVLCLISRVLILVVVLFTASDAAAAQFPSTESPSQQICFPVLLCAVAMVAAGGLTKQLANAIPLSKAAAYFSPVPNISAVHRWANQGIRGIRLQTWRSGGRRVTTPEAIEEFLTRLNATDEPAEPVEPGGVDSERATLAGAQLAALGVH